jgi:hypothetical protein
VGERPEGHVLSARGLKLWMLGRSTEQGMTSGGVRGPASRMTRGSGGDGIVDSDIRTRAGAWQWTPSGIHPIGIFR